jgi:hypothetical protein
LRNEAIRDSALIEHLDRAYVQPACAQTVEVLARAPLDNGHVDTRQRQLARQHQARRTSSGDHYRMVDHRHTPAGFEPAAAGASHPSDPGSSGHPGIGCLDSNQCISYLVISADFGMSGDYAA